MKQEELSVRPWQIEDFESIIDYFLQSGRGFLFNMRIDISKLPSRNDWLKIMSSDFCRVPEKKQFYYIMWLLDGKAIGHSNINKIVFGEEAYMHLHVWDESKREKGIGLTFLKKTLPHYFNTFHLKALYCEPYALNPAPNKALEKLGFDFIKSYDTMPGWINLYQTVNRWCMTEEKFRAIHTGKNIC